MTFPYPLTPEVRADLWQFMGLPSEAAAAMTVPPVLPALVLGPRNDVDYTAYELIESPFARAFVAWREAKASPADADPTISALLAATRDLRTFTHRDSGSPGSAAHDAVDREFFRRLRIVEAADRAWVAAGCPQLPPKVTP